MTGMYYEEFEIGKRYEHQPGRTVCEADNLLFTTLSMNPQSLHLDAVFAGQAQFGQILVNSLFTLATVIGLSVGDTTVGTTVGNLGFDETKFPNPVFLGDTIFSSTVIVDKRESSSRPDWGIVTFRHEGHNQRGELVCTCIRKGMMIKRSSLAEGDPGGPWHGSRAAQHSEVQHSEVQHTEVQHTEGQQTEGQQTEGQQTEGQQTEGQQTEGQA